MEKVKVMLVDEYQTVQRMIALLNWDKRGYTVFECMKDGEGAFEDFKRFRPDIVFAGSRLDGIGSLEFIRRSILIKHAVKIILLTDCNDFEFMNQAMDLGVQSVILRNTLSRERLLSKLEKSKAEIFKDNLQRSMVKRQLEMQLLGMSKTINSGMASCIKWFVSQYGEYYLMMSFTIDKPYPLAGIETSYKSVDACDLILEKDSLPEWMKIFDFFNTDEETLLLILASDRSCSKSDLGEIQKSIADSVQRTLREKYHVTYSAACLQHFVTLHEIRNEYKILKNVRDIKVFYCRESFIALDNIYINMRLGERTYPELDADIFFRRPAEFVLEIEVLFNEVIRQKNMIGFSRLCKKLIGILTTIYSRWKSFSENAYMKKWEAEKENWYCAVDIKAWFIEEFSEMESFFEVFKNCSNIVRQVLKYINDNYMNQASLKEIAEKLDLNSMYLGQKFKRETGLAFSEMLKNIRVEKAKCLLRSGKYKIYEIAALVGYNNSHYFSRIFKDTTSLTPHEFEEKFNLINVAI